MEYLFVSEGNKSLYKGTPEEIAKLVELLANAEIDIDDEDLEG